MALTLHNIKPSSGSKKKKTRRGRGNASGKGTYGGRGLKGQRSRSGSRQGLKYKGYKRQVEQMPKKRGFRSIHAAKEVVNIKHINALFSDGDTITPSLLLRHGLITNVKSGVKVLGECELSKKFIFKNIFFSKTARIKVEKAGGEIIKKQKKTRTGK